MVLFILGHEFVEYHDVRRILFFSENNQRTLTTVVAFASQSLIRSNEESLYAMYGQGNLAYDNKQLLHYI